MCACVSIKYVYAQQEMKSAYIRTTEIFKFVIDIMRIVTKSLFIENIAILLHCDINADSCENIEFIRCL